MNYWKCSSEHLVGLFIQRVGKYNKATQGKEYFDEIDSFILLETGRELKKRCMKGADIATRKPLLPLVSFLKDVPDHAFRDPKTVVDAFNKGFSFTKYMKALQQKGLNVPVLVH